MSEEGVSWFNLLQSFGIISAFLFTAYQLRKQTKSQKLTYLLQVTQAHREIWFRLVDKPELSRVQNPHIDLDTEPIKSEERVFVTAIILHLNCVLELSTQGMTVPIEGMEKDVGEFFSLPIPEATWNDLSHLQNRRLKDYVNSAVISAKRSRPLIVP